MQNKYDTSVTLEDNSSLTYILKTIKPGSTVLEFGPATGYMTKYLKEEMQCYVYIVEIDSDAYASARPYAVDGVCGSAESKEWYEKFANIRFDYVTFADVLEHLVNPSETLKCATSLLKEDVGQVLVSIPNIAHNAVLIDLFNNKFEYRRTGIMDNTHLRFFTHDSAVKMFQQCGLHVVNEDAVLFNLRYTGFNNTENDVPENIWRELQLREYGFVNQFLFTLGLSEKKEKNITKHPSVILEDALYYTCNNTYTEAQKKIGKIFLMGSRFKTEFLFDETINTAQIMLGLFGFSGKVSDLQINIDGEEVINQYIKNIPDATGAYLCYQAVNFELDFEKVRCIKQICVTGKLVPIQMTEVQNYIEENRRHYNDTCTEYGKEIGRLNGVILEKLNIIAELGELIKEQDVMIARKDEMVAERDEMVAERDVALAEKDTLIRKIKCTRWFKIFGKRILRDK